MKKYCFALYSFLFAITANSATVKYVGGENGRLEYSEETEWGKLDAVFEKTGNNRLYTFCSVSLDGVEVNHTRSSNNIGGFYADGWWMGGNHNDGEPNANTIRVSVALDGKSITPGVDQLSGSVLTVEVENDIFFYDKKKFCTEMISYSISGNSIEISGEHRYCHPQSIIIDRYYPMQSVFVDEKELLTPGGKCRIWTPLVPASEGEEIEITKASAPNFCTFVEHSDNGYQAVYLSREGIGNRDWVRPGDVIFIGNSWGKCYHKAIGNYAVKDGDVSKWHGVYSWFRTPIRDNCRKVTDDLTFDYGAFINGEPVVMHLSTKGELMQVSGIDEIPVESGNAEIAEVGDGFITVSDEAKNARCYTADGRLVHIGSGTFDCAPGVYLVSDMKGHVVRLSVN